MNAALKQAHPLPTVADAFKSAMRGLASGVSVIMHGTGPTATGFTATSVSSLSAEPPTLIVSVNRSASLYAQVKTSDRIGVNVLGAQHAEIADRFAGRGGVKGAERFRQGRWLIGSHGALVLADAVAAFECEVEDIIERHTHAIIIGRVHAAKTSSAGGALVYWRGAYDRLGWTDEELSRAVGLAPKTSGGVVVPFSESPPSS